MALRTLLKSVLVVLIGLSALGLPACATNEARPEALTGQDQEMQQPHERHATGIESQAKDM